MTNRITRRGLGGLLAAAPLAAQGQAAAPPNIVFILSDDHSAPYLGCYGDKVIRTPNLDRFASEGMRFDRAFTAAPQCVPSRTAYLTGRSPVGARMGRFNGPLPRDVVSLPEVLRKRGYFTGVLGRGFHLDGPAGGNRGNTITHEVMKRHEMYTWQDRVDYLDRGSNRQVLPQKLGEFFAQRPKDKPFFLWANFSDPHHVWDRNAIPQPHDPKALKLPPHLPDLPGMRDDLGRYFDEIARMDGDFQLILDTLKKNGAGDNTLIVFAGDNGMAFPHGKGSLYDPGLNVPFLVRWPAKVKAGTSTRALVSGEDVTPTLIEAAGGTPPREMSGRSFLPLLLGKTAEHRKYIFAARLQHGSSTYTTKASGWDLSRCVRSDRWKLIYNLTPHQEYQPVDSANDPGWKETVAAHQAGTLAPALSKTYFTSPRPVFELYDLDADPSELNNLAGRPEVAAVEKELKLAMQEKLITDHDFVPLPLNE